MEVCKELKKLAKEVAKYNTNLYIVGGYVRDNILGLDNQDIDITSNLDHDKLLEICSKLKIKTQKINKQLGTIQLIVNDKKFEYTRFRRESYSKNGVHTPNEVEFIDDIEQDTLRRDFTINAIYYDITKDQLVDVTNGMADIEKRIIRTTNLPSKTLKDDGVRILRAIRFASTLNFKIEGKTFKALKTFTPYLNMISKERILKELKLITSADLKHNRPNTHFMNMCNKLSLPKYIFNSSLSRMHKFNHNDITAFYSLPTQARLIGFYMLVLKKYFKGYITDNQLAYSINMLLGINGIKESNEHILTTERLYRIYQNLEFKIDDINAAVNYLTLSTIERNIIDCIISKGTKVRLSDKITFIKNKNLPLCVQQLDICTQDLLELNIERKYISKIMSTLLNQVLNIYIPNEKEALKKLALELHETFTKITKEIS